MPKNQAFTYTILLFGIQGAGKTHFVHTLRNNEYDFIPGALDGALDTETQAFRMRVTLSSHNDAMQEIAYDDGEAPPATKEIQQYTLKMETHYPSNPSEELEANFTIIDTPGEKIESMVKDSKIDEGSELARYVREANQVLLLHNPHRAVVDDVYRIAQEDVHGFITYVSNKSHSPLLILIPWLDRRNLVLERAFIRLSKETDWSAKPNDWGIDEVLTDSQRDLFNILRTDVQSEIEKIVNHKMPAPLGWNNLKPIAERLVALDSRLSLVRDMNEILTDWRGVVEAILEERQADPSLEEYLDKAGHLMETVPLTQLHRELYEDLYSDVYWPVQLYQNNIPNAKPRYNVLEYSTVGAAWVPNPYSGNNYLIARILSYLLVDYEQRYRKFLDDSKPFWKKWLQRIIGNR